MSDQHYIEAYSRENQLKYRWPVRSVAQESGLHIFHGAWGRPLEQEDGSEAPVTNQSLEFIWSDQLYIVSVIYDEQGKLKEFYGRSLDERPDIAASDSLIRLKLAGSDLQISPSFKYDIISSVDDNADQEGESDGWLELFLALERREGPFDPKYLERYAKLAGLA